MRLLLSFEPPIRIHRWVDSVRLMWMISMACFTPLESVSYSLPVSGSRSLHIFRK
jgi:hypothetical protein